MIETVKGIEEFAQFGDDRVYILMAIARTKENKQLSANSDEVVFREVVRNRKDIRRKYERLRALANGYRPDEGGSLNFRLYISVNARNTMKAFFGIRRVMDEWMKGRFEGDLTQIPKFGRIDSYWKSELQKPYCREDQFFIFDIDSEEAVDAVMKELEEIETPIMKNETPNGAHIVTEPFRYTGMESIERSDVELKNDGMLLLSGGRWMDIPAPTDDE